MIVTGDSRHIPLPDGAVHVAICSPPYYKKRVYHDLKEIEWGDGWKGHLGLEPTPYQYIEHLVQIFREVRRVLRPDSTLWVNIGDTYAGSGGAGGDYSPEGLRADQPKYGRIGVPLDMKPKDLMGIPHMLALAMRADGWYWRSDVIWAKGRDGIDVGIRQGTEGSRNYGNAYPSSAKDRPQLAHEHIHQFTSERRYAYDYFGSRVSHDKGSHGLRGVWIINSRNSGGGKHYAAYPPELVDQILKTVLPYCCRWCGAWVYRITKKKELKPNEYSMNEAALQQERTGGVITGGTAKVTISDSKQDWGDYAQHVGWDSTCEHVEIPDADFDTPIVLDPFSGYGSTGVSCARNGYRFIGIELSRQYSEDSYARLDRRNR